MKRYWSVQIVTDLGGPKTYGSGSGTPRFHVSIFYWGKIGVADPGSGIQCFFDPWTGIRNRFFPDPGSQTHIFESLMTILWFLWLQKKVEQIFFHPSLLLLFRDPGKNVLKKAGLLSFCGLKVESCYVHSAGGLQRSSPVWLHHRVQGLPGRNSTGLRHCYR
jgi:hypothetical protein